MRVSLASLILAYGTRLCILRVVAIADGSSLYLTKLNTYMRRVDLLTSLVAPLVVSLLTTLLSYPSASLAHLVIACLTLGFEFLWISVVWNSFKELGMQEERRWSTRSTSPTSRSYANRSFIRRFKDGLLQQIQDIREFIQLPVFLSE